MFLAMLLDESVPIYLSSLPWSGYTALGGVYEQDMEIKSHSNQDNVGIYWLVKGTCQLQTICRADFTHANNFLHKPSKGESKNCLGLRNVHQSSTSRTMK